MSDQLAVWRFAGIGIGALLTSGFALMVWHRTPWAVPTSLLVLWSSFAVVSAISAAVNGELVDDAVELFWLLVCVPLCLFVCGAVALRHTGFKTLLWSLAISHALIVAASLIYDPAIRFRYLGLLGDPNQLGVLSLMPGLLVIFFVPPALERTSARWLRFPVLSLLLAAVIFLIAVSSHRTSLVTIAVCLLVALFRFKGVLVRALMLLLPSMAILAGLALLWDGGTAVLDQLVDKNSSAIAKGEILGGRAEIWRLALEDVTPFGHGKDFFEVNTNRLGAHNSFLHVLGTRGWLAAALLAGICLQSFYFVIRLCCDSGVDYESSQGPLLVVTAYWLLSMAEGMFGSLGTGVHMGFLMTLGYSASLWAERRRSLVRVESMVRLPLHRPLAGAVQR